MAKITTFQGTKEHRVVSENEWLAARKSLLVKEKKFTRARDQLNRQRRELPWVKVTQDYVFDGPHGRETLAELFGGKRQLVVYHFMFGPDWDQGCAHCSFWADHFDGTLFHLGRRDTSLVVISRAPLRKIAAFKQRMGWKFKWVSSLKNTFNFDYQVSFTPEEMRRGIVFYNYVNDEPIAEEREGVSAFYKDRKGEIYHTYSAYARGIDMLNATYHFLDLTAKGRDENPERTQDWVRYRDR
jgi:predicted dithiol-disulfide oxidoreductase (DUF899 family)